VTRDEFKMEDPDDAEAFLASFSGPTQRKGESYLRAGRVTELLCLEPGRAFSAKVQGSDRYQVDFCFDDTEGWTASCSCPLGEDCKHIYAALKALLAENSVAQVRGLSAASAPASPRPAAAPLSRREPVPDGALAAKVAAALGRGLRKDEAQFLRKVTELYRRRLGSSTIPRSDLLELGYSAPGYPWDQLRIWPAAPRDEIKFWLYLAHAIQEQGFAIPAFMEAVTDAKEIQAELQGWRRAEEVARWRHALTNARRPARRPLSAVGATIDLRVRLGSHGGKLEWKPAGAVEFEPMKQRQCRDLGHELEECSAQLSVEGELIWQAFQQQLYHHPENGLTYSDYGGVRALSRLVRHPALQDRIVNEQGRAFARAAAPLRWAVSPAPDEEGNYRVRLARADGSPAPPLLGKLPGQPLLYVTAQAIFHGPVDEDGLLQPGQETAIPAPVIESRAGVQFLNNLGAELPAPVRERLRPVAITVKVHCKLAPQYPGGDTEVCVVKVTALSDDRTVEETWTGAQWTSAKPLHAIEPAKEETGEIPTYDLSVLDEVAALLRPLDLKLQAYHDGPTLKVTKKFPEVFVPWLKSLPTSVQVHLAGDLASLARDPVAGSVSLDVTEAGVDWFDLRVVLNMADTELTQEELNLLLAAKGRYVRLGRKGWRRLEFALTDEEDERLARLGLNPRELSSEPQRLHALQLADDAAKRFLPAEQVVQIQRRASEIKARVTPELPPNVQAELRPYQRDGFHFLAYLSANHFGGILADDMGLGKTLQALVWLAWLRAEAGTAAGPSLVVCPKSVMDNWRAEAERFTPGVRVKLWPASELGSLVERLGEADLHVINYSQLRLIGESLVPVSWLAVILDEGQYIKNANSQTAQVARALRAEHRLVLSGTPIENRLLDLWSLMAFAMPGILGSRAQFGRLYDAKEDPLARRRLSARVRPFLLRRTKTQVAKDLPERIEEDLFCEIEGEQKSLYRAELKRAQQMLLKVKTQKQLAKDRFHFLTSLLRLRQICCHPALINPDSKAESAKVNALLEQLEPLMEEGNKVLVFSQFVEMLQLLKTALEGSGWNHFYLAGDTENRGELVQRFQNFEGAAVFLISLKAGGFGLNLTAASYVVLFDPWWNPAVENQAIDRTHRIGQTNNVIAYRLLIKDSIEEKIRALQKTKSALAEDVLGEEKFSQSLALEDLQFLFSD